MSFVAGPFLAPPLKRADKVDLKTPMRNFIYSTYGQDADNFNQALGDLQTARDACCSGAMDKHESSVDTLTRFVASSHLRMASSLKLFKIFRKV